MLEERKPTYMFNCKLERIIVRLATLHVATKLYLQNFELP